MALYNPDEIPPQAEIDTISAKIETMTGRPIDPVHKAAITGMTRAEIATFIKQVLTA